MCGIAGFVGFHKPTEEAGRQVRAMCDAIRHRGPDADGYHVADGVAMGMQYLAFGYVPDPASIFEGVNGADDPVFLHRP